MWVQPVYFEQHCLGLLSTWASSSVLVHWLLARFKGATDKLLNPTAFISSMYASKMQLIFVDTLGY